MSIVYVGGRRNFLKISLLSSAFIVTNGSQVFGAITPLQTLSLLQDDLFPQAKSLHVKSSHYLSLYVLRHPRITYETKQFIRNGTKWLNESSVEIYDEMYVKLPTLKRQAVLKSIAQEEWGENFIYTILSYIMEATLSDPIYGASTKEQGWQWLEFNGGYLRPKKVYM